MKHGRHGRFLGRLVEQTEMEKSPSILIRFRQWIRNVFIQLDTLWLAIRDARVSLLAKALAFVTLAYAVSPIDLIPDFIPVLGQLDDMIIVPLGIALSLRLIAPEIRQELRAKVISDPAHPKVRPSMRAATAITIVIATWGLISLLFFRNMV